MHPLVPALGAAVVFLAGHAATEVVFSNLFLTCQCLWRVALLILCCDGALPLPRLILSSHGLYVLAWWQCCWPLLCCWGGNLAAARMVASKPSFESLASGPLLDKYEWADYGTFLCAQFLVSNITPDICQQRQICRAFGTVNSNTIPIYLAEYYSPPNAPEQAFAMLEKYADYVAFRRGGVAEYLSLLQSLSRTGQFTAGRGRIVQMLNDWNEQNMGPNSAG